MGMFFILGTLAQVGAHPKEKVKPPRETLDILLLGHHLRRSARSVLLYAGSGARDGLKLDMDWVSDLA